MNWRLVGKVVFWIALIALMIASVPFFFALGLWVAITA